MGIRVVANSFILFCGGNLLFSLSRFVKTKTTTTTNFSQENMVKKIPFKFDLIVSDNRIARRACKVHEHV
jgi:hypothetical protein